MSFLATLITIVPGGSLGLAAASIGGWVEKGILWLANTFLSIPGLILALLLVALFGQGIGTLTLAVGLGGIPGFARISRSAFRQHRDQEFVAASRALGGDTSWIAIRHLLPNAKVPLAALATTYFAWAFVAATSLTFLGLGGDPALPEWGALLRSGRDHLFDAPYLAILPGLAISLTVFSVHSIGAWLTLAPGGPEIVRRVAGEV
jgi:peptide/nickel transport system permease protein